MIRRAILVLFAAILAACATSKLAPETKASLRSVHVTVEFPEKPFVAPPEGGALSFVSGKIAGSPREASMQYEQLLSRHMDLGKVIQQQAKQELVRKGYRVADAPGQADAKLRFVVFYGLGFAGTMSNGRAVTTTVNMELVRSSDSKRLVFSIANMIEDPENKALLRTAPYEQWFSDEELLVSQHRLVAESLTAQAMAGL